MANNNPGNIVDSPWTRQQPGYAGTKGRFAVFDTPQDGMAAMSSLLGNYHASGLNTISGIVNKWAPPSENPTSNYVQYVAQRTGIDPSQPIDPTQLPLIAGAMSEFETGNRPAKGGAVKQYDAAGNPVAAQPTPVPLAPLPPSQAKPQAAAAASSPSDDDLLAKYLGGPIAPSEPTAAATASQSSNAAPAPNADDVLLQQYLGAPAKSQTGAADMSNPMASHRPTTAASTGYTPSAVPVMDQINAFANSAVNAIPIAGPTLTNIGNTVDAGVNNLLGFPTETPADRAAINTAEQKQFPLAAGAGAIAGTVAPLAVAGSTAAGARALGMSGALPARLGMGALSGAGITGLDSLSRGATPQQAGTNALIGGAIGAAAPLVGNALTGIKNAFVGPSANKMVSTALAADQNAPGQVNQLLQNLGPGATIADTGPNAQALAGGLASLPGQPQTILKNALVGRAAGASDRLAGDVAANLGNGQPIGALTDQIIAGQKAAADPLYAAVRPQPVQMTPALQALGNTPLGKQAFDKAAQMMANDGQSGTGTTVGFFDYAKQALDDITSSAQRAGENNAARQSTDMANTIKNEVDKQVPAYGAARAAFAGPAKVLDAVNLGQSVFTKATSPEALQSQLASMSPSERDGVLQGAQAAVQDVMGNAKNDAAGVQQAFRTNNSKEKLGILIGDGPAQAISDAIDREATFAGTKNTVMGNSLTAARQAMQKMVSPETAGIQLPPQTIQGMTIAAFEKARNALTASYRNKQNVAAANLLMSGAGAPQTTGLAASVAPRNALIAPAAVPLLAKQNNIGLGNMLTWAQPAFATAQ